MTVYVDDMDIGVPAGELTRWAAKWSHMTADTREELHAFAQSIGLKREWFQPGKPLGSQPSPFWHYDVTKAKKAEAISKGAVLISVRDMPVYCRARAAGEPWSPPAPDGALF